MLESTVEALIRAGTLAIGDGYRAKNDELGRPGLPFARAGNVDGGFEFLGADELRLDRVRLAGEKVSEPGDTVFTSKGTVGRFAFVAEGVPKFVYSPQLCYWRAKNLNVIEPRWLHFWMRSDSFKEQVNAVKGQTDMADYVSLQDQRLMTVALPPIWIQRRVAELLGALDDKIDLNRRTCRTLETMARALFRSWFVDFDPVVAKSEGRAPFGMDAATAALFPDRLVEGEGGVRPVGWKAASIAALCHLNPETWTPATAPNEIRYLDLATVKFGDPGQPAEMRFAEAPSRARRVVRRGDTIIGTVRPANGAYALIGDRFDGVTVSTGFAVLSPRDRGNAALLYLAATDAEAIEHFAAVAEGSAYPAVAPEQILRYPALLPPDGVCAAFASATVLWLALSDRLRAQSRTLATLRDTLLPRLLSGEVTLKQAESAVAAVV